tara:strand:+ start:327 stop:689 length:363 start_codon:yes stop_codon:yes gene_type:complete
MASTRNKNMPNDYYLEQNAYNNIHNYKFYKHSQYGTCLNPAIPCVGYTPSHIPRDVLSHNPIEIESALFGINASNLVNPQKPVQPYLKHIPQKDFFERVPIIMPQPLVIEDDQRPLPTPN